MRGDHMRRKSLYAFSLLKGLRYEELSGIIKQFIKDNQPELDKEKTEGFIKFEEYSGDSNNTPKYIYFEFYHSDIKEKPDPAGIGTYQYPIKESIPIAITSDPFMLLIFTSYSTLRDHILSKLPISPEYREGFGFSSDFIEFINVPRPEEWMEIVFEDEIEPRGRKGRQGKTHEITERYAGPEERDTELEKRGYVFREFAEALVALEQVSVLLRIYPNGKITVTPPGSILALTIPYIAQALKILKDAEKRYYELKKSAQGGNGNGENTS